MASSALDGGTRQVELELLGGQRVRLLRNERATAPLVLIAPALGLRADYYAALCQALAGAGVHAAAIDLPGHGASPVRAGRGRDWGYLEVLDHLSRARVRLCAELGVSRCVWLGHSIGGQLALMDAGRAGEAVSAVILVASGTPYYRGWEGVAAYKILAGTALAQLVARTLGYLPGEQLGFAGREAHRLISEWASLSRTGRYQCAGVDAEDLLGRCQVPILSLRLAGDTLAPLRAVEHGLSKVGSKDVAHFTIEPADRRNIHNRWPRTPEPVVRTAVPFLERFANLNEARVAEPEPLDTRATG